MSHATLMTPADTALLVIDVQEKLMPLIPRAAEVIRNIAFLAEMAKVHGMIVLGTEQYPKGLGPTVPELLKHLPERPEKTAFSCCAIPSIVDTLHRQARPKVVLVGIEAHVCVLQTALDLLAEGFRVYVVADTVASRFDVDRKYALRRMEQAGAILTTAESAAFEWTGRSGTPEFKILSKLVQERAKAT
jgi:nicotinamidase-related amidase